MSPVRVESTLNEIRRVALDLFSTKGYEGTSIRDIAEGVGIRTSSMYHHFASKEAILWELTRTAFAQLTSGWEEERDRIGDADPWGRLVGFVRSDVRYHAVHRREASIINAQLASLAPEHLAEAVRRRAEYETLLHDLVAECLAGGGHSVPHGRLAVYAILQMCAAVAGWYRPDGELSVEEVCEVYAAPALKMLA
jgi:TetR/AcrR family transcriptional regulator, cholesterol catabolism regulator